MIITGRTNKNSGWTNITPKSNPCSLQVKEAFEGSQVGTKRHSLCSGEIRFIYHDHEEDVKQWLRVLSKSKELQNEQLSTVLLPVGSFWGTEENIPTVLMENATMHVLASSLKFHEDIFKSLK